MEIRGRAWQFVARGALLAAAAGALVVAVEPGAAAYPGKNGRIAFVSSASSGGPQPFNSGSSTIRATDDRGVVTLAESTNLSHLGSENGSGSPKHHRPAWSPDGRKVAYVRDLYNQFQGDLGTEIWVMRANGNDRSKVSSFPSTTVVIGQVEASVTERLSSPTWSPDGRKIAVLAEGDFPHRQAVYVMDAGGGSRATLIRDGDGISKSSLEWSPDGRNLVFSGTRAPASKADIYVMGADGRSIERLTKTASAAEGSPAWSPDGKRIAFTSDRAGNQEIYVMLADGSRVTRLTRNQADDGGAAWSPDGKRIAFHSNRHGAGFDIYAMNDDGSRQTRRTATGLNGASGSVSALSPSWQPIDVPPALGELTLSPTRLAPGPSKLTVGFTLSEFSRVEIVVRTRATKARRFRVEGVPGRNVVSFAGRFEKQGRYTLIVTARDLLGNKARRAATATFSVEQGFGRK